MSAARFEYSATDAAGQKKRGFVSAPGKAEAYRQLTTQGLIPIRIKAADAGRLRRGRSRVPISEITQFTRELAVLLEAGVPVVDGIRGIAEQTHNPRVRAATIEIAADIQAGSTVSDALAKHSSIFGDVFVETVHAAERSGNMVRILEDLAEMLDAQAEFQRQIKRALTYPVLVTVTLSIAVAFLLAFVVPKFAELFERRGVELPLLTQVLMYVGTVLRSYWWALAAGAGAGWLFLRKGGRAPYARELSDRLLHSVPHLKQVLVGTAVARFARVFGLCIGSGLPLSDSLELSSRSTGRPLLERDVRSLIEGVHSGDKLSTRLDGCDYFPSFAKRMIAAGEESAQLQRMCGIIAKHYDRETSHIATTAAAIIEPLLIVVLTGAVLIVALAIFVPMWDLAGLVG